ncbi:calcium-binding protein [Phenylobacterium sp.]|uniref:calcium-binding protein n=1 Tax=Phenylobacterium sp. TaxID=1871053 RepID=UPI002810B05E|nr:calcium-binding protein [Phenylobacterium sp.]
MSAGTYADLLRALGQNESGNNYSFVSSVGYLGRFQFSEEALQAIGFYNGDSTHALDFIGGWTDKARNLGVWDKSSFLASPGAQDAAQDAWFQRVWQDATQLNLQSYIGQWVAGVQVTPSGILGGAHLVGVWNLKSWLESGGAIDTRDPYGTPVSQYVGKFAGYDTPFTGGGGGGGPGPVPTSPPTPAPSPAPQPDTGSAGQALHGSDANDHLTGAGGADTLTGGGGENVLRGGAGADSLQGGWQFDDLHGNTGNDTVVGGAGDDWVVGGQDDDRLFGEDGGDVVLGNLGVDFVDGGGGDDVVRGGQGDDSVQGGWGNDYLSGDRGADTLAGGSGADVFHVFEGSNQDLVLDFNYWEGDRVDALGAYWVSQTDQGVLVQLNDGQMLLQGVQLSSLPEGWIS